MVNNVIAVHTPAVTSNYVGILRLVSWNKRGAKEQRSNLVKVLMIVSERPKGKSKVAATGLADITNPKWFADVVLNPIKEKFSHLNFLSDVVVQCY